MSQIMYGHRNGKPEWEVWLTKIGGDPDDFDDCELIDMFPSIAEAAKCMLDALAQQQHHELHLHTSAIQRLESELEGQQVKVMLAEAKGHELKETVVVAKMRSAKATAVKRNTSREIRTFYAVCAKKGLNTKRWAAMRDALGCFFDIEFKALDDVTAGQWREAIDAVKSGTLRWK